MAYQLLRDGTVIATDSDNIVVNLMVNGVSQTKDLRDIIDAYNLYISIRNIVEAAERLKRLAAAPPASA